MRLADLAMMAAGLLRRTGRPDATGLAEQPAARRSPMRIDSGELGDLLERFGQDAARRRSDIPPITELFRLPEPMAGVLPEKGGKRLAEDDSISAFMAANNSWGFVNNSGLSWLGYPYLTELSQRQEYRLISQVFAEEMTREWIEFEITEDKEDEKKKEKIKDIEQEFKKYDIKNHFHEAIMLEGLMGIGHLYIDIAGVREDAEALKSPLILDKRNLKKGTFRGLVRVEPVWTYPAYYNSTDPLRADFFRPNSWWVMGKEVHKTRMISLVFRQVPDLIKPVYMFGGISLTQLCMPAVQNWIETRSSVNNMIDAFSTMAFATNLGTVLNGGSNQSVIARVLMFNNMRNNRGSFVYDKETEDLKNVSAPLGGLADLQAQALEHVPAMARQPLVKFTGLQPAGLNASSDGEIRTFYDTMHALQEAVLRPAIDDVFKIIQINKYGEIDPDLTYKFKRLWQLDDAGKAAVDKTEADVDEVLYNIGAVDGSEIRQRWSMKSGGLYQGVDLSKPLPEPEPMEPADPVSDPLSQHIERQSVEGGGLGGRGAASGV